MSIKLVTFLLVLQKCTAFDIPHDACRSDLKLVSNRYNLSKTCDGYPTDAHYDVYGNIFYVETGQNDSGYYFDVNVIKFKTDSPQRIPGLPAGISYSIAIDNKDNKVYFGTGQGIYTYNYEAHTATLTSRSVYKLNMIFVDKEGNKYITENNDGIEQLYLLEGENKIPYHTLEALNELAIDDKNNFYFIREEKLYVLKSTQSMPVCIGNVSYDGMAQISCHNNTVFIASDSLTYLHENDTGDLKYVENTPENITAVAFDKTGDFILGKQGQILEYKKIDCPFRQSRVIDEYWN